MSKISLEEAKKVFTKFVQNLQNEITKEMQHLDSGIKIMNDPWERKDFKGLPGGGGLTRFHQGEIFESAGVNTSTICGAIDPKFASQLEGSGSDVWATGISLIIHPRNPHIPTVHANFRLIHQGERFWFGGGADLTPYYPHLEDFQYFHQVWKEACGPYETYSSMKKVCDHYFTNHHRGTEMRGIGGIFYDHFYSGNLEKDLAMTMELGNNFIRSYFPIAQKRKDTPWTAEDEDFQLHRRGRYVEFNLIHDRGTIFGLKTNGRTESILISLPPRVKYTYNYQPRPHTPQSEMMDYYQPRDW
ncbi:MAG: oxygen-dependent coproporphyrinogen oxidase [Bacteriovoracaceae bacterium]|nr:oxygen-dependent coproporphyrinogen oxidase [Bacteriovoracaceae bacterium]